MTISVCFNIQIPLHKDAERSKKVDQIQSLDGFRRTLTSLTTNSKYTIDALTEAAGVYCNHAIQIVDMILSCKPTESITKLYLIDSIIKNIGGIYLTRFGQVLVKTFTAIFKDADINTRKKLYVLRCTWNNVVPPDILLSLDTHTKEIDNNWPLQTLQMHDKDEAVVIDVNDKVCVTVTPDIVIYSSNFRISSQNDKLT